MIATLALAGAMLGAAAPDMPSEHVSREAAAARVAACGAGDVTTMFDDELQEDVIVASPASATSEAQLACVATASLDTGRYVRFPDAVQAAYEPIYRHLAGERGKALARRWLQEQGLLGRLPAYDPQRTDKAAFARTLETVCGVKVPGAALRVEQGKARLTGLRGLPKDGKALWCLINAAVASGYPLTITGNGAGLSGP